MRVARLLIAIAAACWGGAAAAQVAVESPAPDAVSVTLYRDPQRDADDAIERFLPGGYALLTETRRVVLPPGPVTIRFVGVSAGILPESVIMRGVPGVAEKNYDADLLSPRALFDRSTGRRVTVRRTDPASGAATVEPAIIRSGAAGGMVVETAGGVEAVQCSGLAETLLYHAVPEGLAAEPTLSVTIADQPGGTADITLSYLANGFDWQANHVLTMRPDGAGADWFAWVTLASGDATSHEDAATQLVAGRLEREDPAGIPEAQPGSLLARCWTLEAALPLYSLDYGAPPPPPPPPPPSPPAAMIAQRAEIVVTGARMVAQEELGDLKLYRVPMPVTVAARAQKQVGLIDRTRVRLRPVYRSDVFGDTVTPPVLLLRGDNRETAGLGLPIPAGPVQLFDGHARPILIGEGAVDDRAVGDEVEIAFDPSPTIGATLVETDRHVRVLTVTNAQPRSIRYEARIAIADGARIRGRGVRIVREEGRWIARLTVPANATRSISWRISDPDRD